MPSNDQVIWIGLTLKTDNCFNQSENGQWYTAPYLESFTMQTKECDGQNCLLLQKLKEHIDPLKAPAYQSEQLKRYLKLLK